MASLKEFADECLDEDPPLSVVRDVFGFRRGVQREMSVRDQIPLARGESIGINAILVCPESFSAADRREVEYAIQVMREIYAKQDVGVRTIDWRLIPTEDAPAYCSLGASSNDSDALTNDWTVPNDFMDVFFVDFITGGTAGWSAVDGPCSKNEPFCGGMSGSVVEVLENPDVMGVILAHEVGHYLGLGHTTASNNFMRASVGSTDTNITSSQGNTMKNKDCFAKDVC